MLTTFYLDIIGAFPAHSRVIKRSSMNGISSWCTCNPTLVMILKNVFFSLLIWLDLAPTIYYFVTNLSSLAKSTAASYMIGVLANHIATYWCVLADRNALDVLLYNLRAMVQMGKGNISEDRCVMHMHIGVSSFQ